MATLALPPPASTSGASGIKGSSTFFQQGGSELTPILLAAQPRWSGETITQVTFWVDTYNSRAQLPNQGVYVFTLDTGGENPATRQAAPQLLLTAESYRAPLRISPDFTRLAIALRSSPSQFERRRHPAG
ncbi:MAG: hypothetical protein R3E79_32155 [Caldilineaceae bacterium]